MKRTVTALYETRAQAERARDALVAANLGDDVEIRDNAENADDARSEHHDFGSWLAHLFGGHHDRHLYAEGVRRGHFLLAAKVDELSETRAAEILDAATPLDLERAQNSWRAEGWAPVETTAAPISTAAPGKELNDKAPVSQADTSRAEAARSDEATAADRRVGVRVYSFEESYLDR